MAVAGVGPPGLGGLGALVPPGGGKVRGGDYPRGLGGLGALLSPGVRLRRPPKLIPSPARLTFSGRTLCLSRLTPRDDRRTIAIRRSAGRTWP